MTLVRLTRYGIAGLAIVMWATTVSSAQTSPATPPTAMLTVNAPAFLFPDATRTPLAILPAGTVVVVLRQEGEWYRVRFRDPVLGDRTGYVAAANIQLQPAKPQGPTASPRSGSPRATPRRPVQRPARKPTEPSSISINGGVQTTSRGFAAVSTISRFAENGTLSSTYSSGRPIVFDVAVQGGVWRTVSVALAATGSSEPLEGSLTTKIPHPFFFDRPRTVTGQSADLSRKEVAVHLDGVWTIPVTGSTRVALFAGPSYFKVTQSLVTDITVNEAYPYDEATFDTATSAEATLSKWGYNAGFDISQFVSRHVGVGVIGRYSRASFVFPIVETEEVAIRAGGFQVGGGVRLRF